MSPETALIGTRYTAYRSARAKGRVPKAGGPCHLCGHGEESEFPRAVLVDHCHECGIIRGVLCGDCNANMFAADQAAGGFPLRTVEWLAEVNVIRSEHGKPLLTLAWEINLLIDRLHYFIDQSGAARVFAYQNSCACPGGNQR
jgi:Recombination endonuclease VII